MDAMKKIWILLTSILIVIALGIGGFLFYTVNTPEYALLETMRDFKKDGVDGLRDHMTEDAWTKIEKIKDIAENPWMQKLAALFPEQSEELFSKIDNMEWNIKDILKGKESSEVILEFTDGEKIKGTISIVMIKEEKKWKIAQIRWPKFE